jgi:hypothetical protein
VAKSNTALIVIIVVIVVVFIAIPVLAILAVTLLGKSASSKFTSVGSTIDDIRFHGSAALGYLRSRR